MLSLCIMRVIGIAADSYRVESFADAYMLYSAWYAIWLKKLQKNEKNISFCTRGFLLMMSAVGTPAFMRASSGLHHACGHPIRARCRFRFIFLTTSVNSLYNNRYVGIAQHPAEFCRYPDNWYLNAATNSRL